MPQIGQQSALRPRPLLGSAGFWRPCPPRKGLSDRIPDLHALALARPLYAGMDHAGSGVAQDIELAVGVLKLERDRPRRLCRGATNLGQREVYPMRNVDPHPMLLTSRRAHDRSPVRL